MEKFNRRDALKTGLALSAAPLVAHPILSYAAGETPIKIGMHDPLTGTYAAEGESEVRGAKMALAEITISAATTMKTWLVEIMIAWP